MTDAMLRRKLERMLELGNELHAEAQRRYGPEGLLLHEADGSLVIMDKYDEGMEDRNEHIKFAAIGAFWGQGAF